MTASSPRPRWSQLAESVADLVWPRICLICQCPVTSAADSASICGDCRAGLLAEPNATCPRCTSTVGPHTDVANGCPRCRGISYRFASAVRLGPYDGVLRAAILRMKAGHAEPLAETLGMLWADARSGQLTAGNPDVVVPVPLHWRRKWSRGYNQSEALAFGLAARLGLPCRPSALARVRPTPTQRARSAEERWRNVAGAFRAGRRAAVRGLTILLVDDVMTTGATADAASAALAAAGAAQVRLAVLAHR